jgi:hypothetical protein
MSTKTQNYQLIKPDLSDSADIRACHNANMDLIEAGFSKHDTALNDLVYPVAGGTATTITLTMQTLVNGYAKTFIASANNSGTTTTINGKKLYKPGTIISPNLIAGKAYTVWYNSTGDCFFIKASAEGTALAKDVRKNTTFSNDNDTDIPGGLDLSLLISDNLKAGITIDGVTGKSSVVDTTDANLDPNYLVQGYSGYDDGIKKAGLLSNLGASQNAPDTWTDGGGTLKFRVPSVGAFTSNVNGYKPELSAYDGNFISANIAAGKSIFGVSGSYDPLTMVAGSNTILYQRSSALGTGSSTYTLVESHTVNNRGGTVKVKFDYSCAGSSQGIVGYVRIYVNGSPKGVEHSISSASAVTITEDIAINAGDTIQLYSHASAAGYGQAINNIVISCGNSYAYIAS